ncbi:MAG: molybdopterin-dependent oxidoreductase [Rubrimonas sp.]
MGVTRRVALAAAFVAASGALAGVTAAEDAALVVRMAQGQVAFEMDDLRAMPRTAFTTRTIWTEGEVRFEGVELAALVARLGLQGRDLRLSALNEYSVVVPAGDATPGGALIAYAVNGAPMSVRDKGPLWLVYPYDSDPAFRTESIYARSIWQLARIEVVE